MNNNQTDIYISYYNLGKYITIYDETPDNRKTKLFSLCNSNNEFIHLGEIKYNPNWRKYCFYPIDDTVFNTECLKDIVGFIDYCNNKRKNKEEGF